MVSEQVKIGGVSVGAGKPVVVAGPCVIENFEMLKKTASFLCNTAKSIGIDIVFKASYDKANRTRGRSFRGPGPEKGLEMIAELKKEMNLPLLVDVHCRLQVKPAAEIADCLQIPAFLCRQTDLITEAGATGLAVNIKKGQFMAPGAMPLQAEKALRAGSGGVILTERGTTFGYSDLVVDMRSIAVMKESGCPVLFDATHSQQSPPSADEESGGSRKFAVPLSKAALAAGADGIYAEVHPNPPRAESDRQTQLSFSEFRELADAMR